MVTGQIDRQARASPAPPAMRMWESDDEEGGDGVMETWP